MVGSTVVHSVLGVTCSVAKLDHRSISVVGLLRDTNAVQEPGSAGQRSTITQILVSLLRARSIPPRIEKVSRIRASSEEGAISVSGLVRDIRFVLSWMRFTSNDIGLIVRGYNFGRRCPERSWI